MDLINKENNTDTFTRPRRKAAASASELVKKQVNVSLRTKLRRDGNKIVESNNTHNNEESNELDHAPHNNVFRASNEDIKNIQPLAETINLANGSISDQQKSRYALTELVPQNISKTSKSSKSIKQNKLKKGNNNIHLKDAGNQHLDNIEMPPPTQSKRHGHRKKINTQSTYNDEIKIVDCNDINLIQEGIKTISVDGNKMQSLKHLEQVIEELSDLELVNDKSAFKIHTTINPPRDDLIIDSIKSKPSAQKNKKRNAKVERRNKRLGKTQSNNKVEVNKENQTNLQSLIGNICDNAPANQIFEQLQTQNYEKLTEIHNDISKITSLRSNIAVEKPMLQNAFFIQMKDKEQEVAAQDMMTDDDAPKTLPDTLDGSLFNNLNIASTSDKAYELSKDEICDSFSQELLIEDSLLYDAKGSHGSSKLPQDILCETYIIQKPKADTMIDISKANPDMTVVISKAHPNITMVLDEPHILDKTVTICKPAITAYPSECTTEEKTRKIPKAVITTMKVPIQNSKQKTTATKIQAIENMKKTGSMNKSTTQASKRLNHVKSGVSQKKFETAAQLKKDRLQLEIEKKRHLREEKELKAKQQRAALEEEKKRNLETHKIKEERAKQALLEKQEKLIKQREEAEKRRLNAKLRHEEIMRVRDLELKAHDEQTQKEQQTNTLPEEKEHSQYLHELEDMAQKQAQYPTYMTHKIPLLPTPDCYDSDDENRRQVILPQWCSKGNCNISLVCMSYLERRINNTLFCIKPRTPDLREIFPNVEEKKLRRKSSAIWNKPPRFTMFVPMGDDF